MGYLAETKDNSSLSLKRAIIFGSAMDFELSTCDIKMAYVRLLPELINRN